MTFTVASGLLNLGAAYLLGDGLISRIASDALWIVAIGLELIGIIWFLVTVGLQSWRFFVEIRSMWSDQRR